MAIIRGIDWNDPETYKGDRTTGIIANVQKKAKADTKANAYLKEASTQFSQPNQMTINQDVLDFKKSLEPAPKEDRNLGMVFGSTALAQTFSGISEGYRFLFEYAGRSMPSGFVHGVNKIDQWKDKTWANVKDDYKNAINTVLGRPQENNSYEQQYNSYMMNKEHQQQDSVTNETMDNLRGYYDKMKSKDKVYFPPTFAEKAVEAWGEVEDAVEPVWAESWRNSSTADKFGKDFGKTLFMTGTNIASSTAIVAATGGFAGNTMAAASVFGLMTADNINQSCLLEGVDRNQCNQLGLMGGGAVALLEKFGLDTILGKGTLGKFGTSYFSKILKAMAAEGFTEFTQEEAEMLAESTFREIGVDERKTRDIMAVFGGMMGGFVLGGGNMAFNSLKTKNLTVPQVINQKMSDTPAMKELVMNGLNKSITGKVLSDTFVDHVVVDVEAQINKYDKNRSVELTKDFETLKNKQYANLGELVQAVIDVLPSDLDAKSKKLYIEQSFQDAVIFGDQDMGDAIETYFTEAVETNDNFRLDSNNMSVSELLEVPREMQAKLDQQAEENSAWRATNPIELANKTVPANATSSEYSSFTNQIEGLEFKLESLPIKTLMTINQTKDAKYSHQNENSQTVVIDPNGNIISGYNTVQQAVKDGKENVPVYVSRPVSKATDLTKFRDNALDNGEMDAKELAILEKTYEIQQAQEETNAEIKAARETLDELVFKDSEMERGYGNFKKIAKKNPLVLESSTDEMRLKAMIKGDLDLDLFAGGDGLRNDEMLEAYKERFAQEQKLRETATQKTSVEIDAKNKIMAEKIVGKPKKTVFGIASPRVTKTEKTLLKDRIKNFARGVRIGTRATKAEIKKIQNQLKDILKDSNMNRAAKLRYSYSIGKIDSQAKLDKFLPDFKKRVLELEASNEKNELQKKIDKELKGIKPKKVGQKRVAKYDYETNKYLQTINKANKYTQAEAQLALDSLPTENLTEMDLMSTRFLSLKVNGKTSAVDLYKQVLTDLQFMKQVGEQAKDEADFIKRMERQERVDEMVKGIDKVKGFKNDLQKKYKTFEEYKASVDAKELGDTIRSTKGLSAEDIIKQHPDINLKKDVKIKDIHGKKDTIDAGEALTPYELKGNKVLLQDGETYIVSKNQYQNIKNQSVVGEAKEFAPELKQTEETILDSGKMEFARYKELYNKLKTKEVSDLTEEEQSDWERLKNTSGLTERGDTKYSQYTLPDGKNYKEILIQAPRSKDFSPEKASAITKKAFSDFDAGKITREERNRMLDETNKYTDDKDYQSSHWSGVRSVLAHLRMNWRKFKGGKVAFMEEAQSDWASDVREHGAKVDTSEQKKEATEILNKYKIDVEEYTDSNHTFDNAIDQAVDNNIDSVSDTDANRLEELSKEIYHADKSTELGGGIPDNPLLNNWLEKVAVPRALQEAVNSDSKYFAWINGEQTSARYNLATYVENVEWQKENDGKKLINIEPKGGSDFNIGIDKTGKIISGRSEFEGKKLDEALGKGLADKIMAEDGGVLTDEGLKFGGEWASNLYDKQVGNIVKKLTGQEPQMMDMGLPVGKEGEFGNWFARPQNGKKSFTLTKENLKDAKGKVVQLEGEVSPANIDYTITKVLGDGKFEAKQSDKMGEPDSSIYKKTFNVNYATEKSKGQQGIEITPEVARIIKGEAPAITEPSGKDPLPTKADIQAEQDTKRTDKLRENWNKILEKDKKGILTKIYNTYAKGFGDIYSQLNMVAGKEMAEKYDPKLSENRKRTAVIEKATGLIEDAQEIFDIDESDMMKKLHELAKKEYDITSTTGTTTELSKMDILDIYNSVKNDLGRERYNRSFGEDSVNELIANLSDAEMRFADRMQEGVQEYAEVNNSRNIELTGRDMGFVDNYWMFTSKYTNEAGFNDDMMIQGETPSAQKSRTMNPNVVPIPKNAYVKYLKHVSESEHVQHLSRKYETIKRLFSSEEVERQISGKFGNDVYKSLMQHIEYISLNQTIHNTNSIETSYDFLINNWVKAKIAVSPAIFVKQLGSMINYTEDMPLAEWTGHFTKGVASPKETFDFMWNNVPFLKARFKGGYSEALKEAMTGASGLEQKGSLTNYLTGMTRSGDIVAIIYGGYPVMQVELAKHGDMQKAVDVLETRTLPAQQYGGATGRSHFQNMKSPIAKTLLKFKNTSNQYLRKQMNAMIAYRNGDIDAQQLAKTTIIYSIINPMVYAGTGWAVKSLWKGLFGTYDDDDDSLASVMIKQLFINPFQAIPFIDDISDNAYRLATGQRIYNLTSQPMLDELEGAFRTLSKNEITLLDYIEVVGAFQEPITGIPTQTVLRYMDYATPDKKGGSSSSKKKSGGSASSYFNSL